MVFPFITGFINQTTFHKVEASMIKVHYMCSGVARQVSQFQRNGESSIFWLTRMREEMQQFKELVKATF